MSYRYPDRAKLAKRIEVRVRDTFWPMRPMNSHCPMWAVGVNQVSPRSKGKIWTPGAHPRNASVLMIGVTVSYKGKYHWVETTRNPGDWDCAIDRALCILSKLMDLYEVEWVVAA